MQIAIYILSGIGCLLTASILIPQIVKVIKTNSAKDISTIMITINISSCIFWIVATSMQIATGFNELQPALIVVNSISLTCAVILLTLKLLHNKKGKQK